LLPGDKPYPDQGNIRTTVFMNIEDRWRIAHVHNSSIDSISVAIDSTKTR
jgi:hypothetical protein